MDALKNVPKPTKTIFGGKTEFSIDYSTPETILRSKTERHFYQRMLRAYLSGKKSFGFGFHYDALGQRHSTMHDVETKQVSI